MAGIWEAYSGSHRDATDIWMRQLFLVWAINLQNADAWDSPATAHYTAVVLLILR